MLKKMMLSAVALTIFLAVPAFAKNNDCKKGGFVGSYTRADPNNDVFGDGSVLHSFAFQLTFHSDGTVNQYWTGLPDYFNTLGTGSPWIGSWTCRNDGKLVVTMITASYTPTTTDLNPPQPPIADVTLVFTTRVTYLFNIDDDNTLTRIQARARRYTPTQDPTDPNGGTLRPLDSTALVYTRLVASDADLVAP